MATHEQTYLGPVIEALEAEGYLTLAEDTNAYAVVARLGELASENGVHINADDACDVCLADDPNATPKVLSEAREINARLFGH
jgi:hypothetical protein